MRTGVRGLQVQVTRGRDRSRVGAAGGGGGFARGHSGRPERAGGDPGLGWVREKVAASDGHGKGWVAKGRDGSRGGTVGSQGHGGRWQG